MNTRKGILGLLLMAMLPLTAQTTERGLKECIRMGIERNFGLKNARIGIEAGHTTVSQARATTYDYGMRRMGQARGGSTLEAQQLSATALRGKITVQATLVAMRDITGTTIWLLVGTIAFVLFFPYHRDEYA